MTSRLAPSALSIGDVDAHWAELAQSLHHMVPLKGLGNRGAIDRLDLGINALGGSVIFTAMQVALWMAPKRIVLLGVDVDYSNRKDAYFYPHEPIDAGRGLAYSSAREAFLMYQEACDRRGIGLINATCGGTLQKVIPYTPLEEL